MEVTCEQLTNGVTSYIDREILPQLPTFKAVGLGTVVALYTRQAHNIVGKIPKSIGIVSESGMIDVDAVRDALKKSMTGNVTFDIPLVGQFTLDPSEVDKLYNYIVR